MLLSLRQLLERLGAPQVVIQWPPVEEEVRVPKLICRHLGHLLLVLQVAVGLRALIAVGIFLPPLRPLLLVGELNSHGLVRRVGPREPPNELHRKTEFVNCCSLLTYSYPEMASWPRAHPRASRAR
jgi:hypothetical protein